MRLKVTQTFAGTSGLPADETVQTFHFDTGFDLEPAELALLADHVATCTTAEDPAWSPWSIAELLSEDYVSRSVKPTVRIYDEEEGGSPIHESQWAANLPAAQSALSYPPEVAVCLSYHGDLTGIREDAPDDADADTGRERYASRHRGRLFIGPLSYVAPNADGTVPNLLINALVRFAVDLHNLPAALTDSSGTVWVVRSNAYGAGPGGSEVVGCWVDNQWDTQRRRGRKATARVVQALPVP